MIDVTATILPSTVMSDRSFDDQMALSAIPAASRYLFNRGQTPCQKLSWGLTPVRRRWLNFDRVAVVHVPNVVVRARYHLISGFEAGQHFEVPIAGDTDL